MGSRSAILDAAAAEMLKHGYAASSLSAIAAHLGLTKGALGRQFPSKADLAWGILDSLRAAMAEETQNALLLYPDSGLRAAARFTLAVGVRSRHEPQLAAATVLFTDRASPTYEVGKGFPEWKEALGLCFARASERGEIPVECAPEDLAEYVLIANIGEAIYISKDTRSIPHANRPMRLMRMVYTAIGVADADRLIDGVVADLLKQLGRA